MAFITSKLQPQNYDFYAQDANKINRVVDRISINGGADVINKRSLDTPRGVVTEIEDDRLEKLKSHPVFRTHLENGFVSIQGSEKAAKKAEETLEKDKSSQITPEDYEKGDEKKDIRPKKKPNTKRG